MDLALPRLPQLGGTQSIPDASARPGSFGNDARRWWALAVLLLAQVMIILDIVVVNVALPTAQRTLHIPPASIQWIVTAYLLPFGGLLLLGGRIADYTGRKRVFLISTVGFALASATGGAAQSEAMLFASRALQGLFAAAMAPALLSMLTLGFPTGRERNIAMSLYTVVGATGGAFGFILGGLLTQYLSWRWCLLINVPASLLVIAGARLLRESRATVTHHYDLVGGASATIGLLGIIYGISNAATHGWGSYRTYGPIIFGVVVLIGFLIWEARAANPLLPLGLVRNRARGAGFLAACGCYGPPSGALLLILVFLQGPQHKSAVAAGLEFLPGPFFGALAAALVLPLLGRVSPRLILLLASVVSTAAFAAMTRLHANSSFLSDVFPAVALLGAGPAALYLTGNTIALADVPDDDSGLVGAMINTFQQVSAALGAAILATVAASSESHYVARHGPRSIALAITHGDRVAFLIGGGLMIAIGIACTLTAPPTRRRSTSKAQARKRRRHSAERSPIHLLSTPTPTTASAAAPISEPRPNDARRATTPAKAADTPAKAADTPAKAADTPAKAADTPAKAADTPAKAAGAPAKAAGAPANAAAAAAEAAAVAAQAAAAAAQSAAAAAEEAARAAETAAKAAVSATASTAASTAVPPDPEGGAPPPRTPSPLTREERIWPALGLSIALAAAAHLVRSLARLQRADRKHRRR
jgi:EmrB/QacA subfamily drug resistance transporter